MAVIAATRSLPLTGVSREILEKQVKPLVVAFIAARGLQLSDEKTVITHIEKVFNFLGQNIRKYGDGVSEDIPEKVNDGSTVSISKQMECETGFSRVQIREGGNMRYFQQHPSLSKDI